MRPQFWLKVRKEYIYDNLDELIGYLSKWPYEIDNPGANKDFDASFECMVALLDDIADAHYSTPVYQNLPDDIDPVKYIRLFGATILAALKCRYDCSRIILNGVAIIQALRSDYTAEVLDKLWHITLSCIRGESLISPGFSWTDMNNLNLSVSMFAHKFANATFNAETRSVVKVFEGNGTAIVDNDRLLKLAPMNRKDYMSTVTKSQISLYNRLQILLPHHEIEPLNSYQSLYKASSDILESLKNVHPSRTVDPIEYTEEEILLVRVTGIDAVGRIFAESIDPRYHRVCGQISLHIDYKNRISPDVLKRNLHSGTILEVSYVKDTRYPFELGLLLEDFYREEACQMADNTAVAVYVSATEAFTTWITSDGIRVRIHNSKLNELTEDEIDLYYDAIESARPITIRFYREAPDIDKEYFTVYAEPVMYNYASPVEPFTVHDAEDHLLQNYIASVDYYNINNSLPFENIDARSMEVMARLLWLSALNADLSSQDMLKYISGAAMIVRILNKECDYDYLQFQRRYQSRLNAFASNRNLLPLTCADEIAGLPDVRDKMAIFDCLCSYNDPDTLSKRSTGNNTLDQVATLVKASNDITGIVGKLELNNIKQAIAKALDVDDEFVSILDSRTFYGIENISLEFKKSIVFPPANRRRFTGIIADPELQKWAILKAIMGFLNSQNGGELLLGVNDLGYADGLADDIRQLYEMRLISTPNSDHYRSYVQRIVDQAFSVYGRNTSPSDIVRLNVTYTIETNNEMRDIMRIGVKPYRYGIVRFADGDRPDTMAESYVRRCGRTVPVTPEMHQEILRWKS